MWGAGGRFVPREGSRPSVSELTIRESRPALDGCSQGGGEPALKPTPGDRTSESALPDGGDTWTVAGWHRPSPQGGDAFLVVPGL
ncbi:hypothetical protein [Streptomyces albicerus]|uniref:hypothetical protein n=1 Tax=Streptomyces albicerus TaxID=2569859 RepID=UPI00124BAA5D|nr:hypothetical protein [Streptomyces albicerus]